MESVPKTIITGVQTKAEEPKHSRNP